MGRYSRATKDPNKVPLRFNSRASLIEALEARRPWARALDKRRLAEHKVAEKAALKRFKDSCREALKWDYQTAAKEYFSVRVQHRPTCPQSVERSLDMRINELRVSEQERFVLRSDTRWLDETAIYWLLTHDEDLPVGDMC